MALKEVYSLVKTLITSISPQVFSNLHWWHGDTEVGEQVYTTPSLYIEFLPISDGDIISLHDASQIVSTRFKLHLMSQFYDHEDAEMQYLNLVQQIHNKLHYHVGMMSELDYLGITPGTLEDIPFTTPLVRLAITADHSAAAVGVMLTTMEYEADITVGVQDSVNVDYVLNMSQNPITLKTNIDYVP